MAYLLNIFIGFATAIFALLITLDLRGYLRRLSKSENVGVPGKRAAREPKALVIVPCRGSDLTLYQNLMLLKKQEYKKYDLVAVIDDYKDTSLEAISKAGLKYIKSTFVCGRCSGKVKAILTAIGRYKNYEVYVTVDSDVTVDRFWLRNLTEPLSDRKIGISTMFPRFTPLKGFWSRVKLLWGLIGEGLMENEATRFGWGGSLAFRQDLLDREALDFFKSSRYSISDDITLTKIAQRKGLSIAYTNRSQPIVYCDEDYRSFIKWSNRQTVFSILGRRKNLYYGAIYYSAEIINMGSGLALSLYISPLFLLFLLHPLQSYIKAYKKIGKANPVLILVPVMPLIYLSNLIVAASMNKVTWRGRTYAVSG